MPPVDANGALRWIRDWAFPVRDAVGLVIRMAGVAEDVTKRRRLEMQLRQLMGECAAITVPPWLSQVRADPGQSHRRAQLAGHRHDLQDLPAGGG